MPLRVYIASIIGNTEIRKQVQRVLMVLDGMGVEYEAIDITEPGKEQQKVFMHLNSKAREGQSVALPPQIFHNDSYIGDYEAFDNAVENNQLLMFLKLASPITGKNRNSVSQINANVDTNDEMRTNGHVDEVNNGKQGDEDVYEDGKDKEDAEKSEFMEDGDEAKDELKEEKDVIDEEIEDEDEEIEDEDEEIEGENEDDQSVDDQCSDWTSSSKLT